jgi:hypothetical protein
VKTVAGIICLVANLHYEYHSAQGEQVFSLFFVNTRRNETCFK